MKAGYIFENDYGCLIFKECKAMAIYAAERGIQMPISVAKTITAYEPFFKETLIKKSERKENPPENSTPDITPLAIAHERLSRIVEPATPQAIFIINNSTFGV